MLRVQNPGEYPACSRLNHCDRFSHYRTSLDEGRRKNCTITPLPSSVSTCQSGTAAKVSSNAIILVAGENTRDIMMWLIKSL